MIYKFIQLLLIYLLTISVVYANLYEKESCDCNCLAAPLRVLKEDKVFEWSHQIDFYLYAKETLKLKGYLSKKDQKRKKNIGIFRFDAGHSVELELGGVNLLDSKYSDKYEKFVLYKNQKVEFIPIKKHAKSKFVDGGFLDKNILKKHCGIKTLNFSKIKCITNQIIPKFNCVNKKGYVISSSPKKIKEKTYNKKEGSKNISDMISSYYKPKSFKDLLISKKESKSRTNNKTNSLSDIINSKKDNKKSRKKIKYKVCTTKGNKKNISTLKEYPDGFSFWGMINNKKVNAYWYDPNLSINPSKEKFIIHISSLKNKYIKIKPYSYKSIKTNNDEHITPIKFSSLPDMPKILLSKKKHKKHTMNIIVVGGSSSIFISGLEKMENILLKKSKSHYQWEINWHDVKPDGSLLVKKEFQSFKELIKYTKKEKHKNKILLPKEVEFRNFINSFQSTILNYKNNIDYVIWIKQGYQLPLITPDLFDGFIKNIHNKAKISRFKNGNPYQWLYILSGNMPGRSKILLEEPMRRANPNPGQVDEEEKINMKHRRLLKRPERLALSLDLAGKRNAKSLPPELDIPSENLFVDAKQILKKTGLLIPIDHIGSDEKTKGISTKILKKIREKKYSAASRNNCTHLFFSGKDMGLSWIK